MTKPKIDLKNPNFKEYTFNLNQLKTEFSSLYSLFLSNKERFKKEPKLFSYLHSVCDLMIQYYTVDYVGKNLKDLQKKKEELEKFLSKEFTNEEQVKIDNFSTYIVSEATSSIKDYASSFVSTSKLREHISTLNTNRTYWNYSRALASHAILYLKNIGFPDFIKDLNAKLGNTYSPDEFVNLLDQSRETLRKLSVGIYALRLMINLVTMTKHIIQAAFNEELSAKKITVQELEKRGFTMLNDVAWGTVNLFTNYNEYFQISANAASQVTVVFLMFDAALLAARWSYEAYQYQNRIQELEVQLENANPLQQEVINRQIDILNDEWEAQCAYYLFNIAVATVLVIGFTASLTFTGPLALASLAALSMLGNAMYLTADDYKTSKRASIAIQREESNSPLADDNENEARHHTQLLKELSEDANKAYSNFWKTLAFNTGGTAFIITAAVISWPVALSVTLGYMAYRVNNSYQSQLGEKDKKQEPRDIYRLFSNSNSANKAALVIPTLLENSSPFTV